MNNTFLKVNNIWNSYLNSEKSTFVPDILKILSSQQIKLRADRSKLIQITLSKPKSDEAFIIGLRYVKIDSTFTEDHYLCPKNKPTKFLTNDIKLYPKRHLENLLPEYQGTHKQQINIESIERLTDQKISITNVSTLSNIIK